MRIYQMIAEKANSMNITTALFGARRILVIAMLIGSLSICMLALPNAATASGSIAGCGDCHGSNVSFVDSGNRNPLTGTFAGSHNKHAQAYGMYCTVCHVDNGTTNWAHANGLIEMATPLNSEPSASYGKGTSWAVTNTPSAYKSCNTYCHTQGTGATGQGGDNRSVSTPLTELTWSTSDSCNSCHGNPPAYSNLTTQWGTTKANSHASHPSQCQYCHYSTTTNGTTVVTGATSSHVNNKYDIVSVGGNTTISSYTYAVDGGTCATISCHGNTDAKWGEAPCVACHTVTQLIKNGPLSNGTNSRRAVSGEFALTSSHKRAASGTVNNVDCIVCHVEGDMATKSLTVKHGDGYVNLRDPDTNAEILQATWGGTGPGAYTNSAVSASFDRFSRNLSSNVVETAARSIMINQCLHCHDTNGATQISVPGGSALKPFNTNAVGTGGNVLDVKSHFATSNRSYHPVLGKQNNSYAYSTRMAAPWNAGVSKTINTTTGWGHLITCFDCHADSGVSGVQNTTVIAHGSNITAVTNGTNSVELRGVIWRRGAAPSASNNTTLCTICHAGYTSATSTAANHGANSALSTPNTRAEMSLYLSYACYYCHASGATKPNYPIAAADAHGYELQSGGGTYVAGAGYAFLRSAAWTSSTYRQYVRTVASPAYTGTTGNCTGYASQTNGTTACSRTSMGTYGPGGVY